MAVFPLQDKQDSKYFSVEGEDPAISSESEGGYKYSRPRHTRTPRKTYTTGFTEISDANKQLVLDFWDDMHGSSMEFQWSDPTTDEIKWVRFKSKPKFDYKGLNGLHLWSCKNITLEEV